MYLSELHAELRNVAVKLSLDWSIEEAHEPNLSKGVYS